MNSDGTGSVPWDDVMRVDGPAGRTWKTGGAMVGFVVDIMLLALGAAMASGGVPY
jgi:hypothetical protein